MQSSHDSLVKSLQENDLVLLKKEFPEDIDLLNKKLAYPYEYFKSFEDYEISFDNLPRESYYSKLTNGYPKEEEIERTNKIIEVFGVKNGRELTELYLKTDVILLADVFEKFIKVSVVPRYLSPNGDEKLVTMHLQVLAINSLKLYDKFIYYNQV